MATPVALCFGARMRDGMPPRAEGWCHTVKGVRCPFAAPIAPMADRSWGRSASRRTLEAPARSFLHNVKLHGVCHVQVDSIANTRALDVSNEEAADMQAQKLIMYPNIYSQSWDTRINS